MCWDKALSQEDCCQKQHVIPGDLDRTSTRELAPEQAAEMDLKQEWKNNAGGNMDHVTAVCITVLLVPATNAHLYPLRYTDTSLGLTGSSLTPSRRVELSLQMMRSELCLCWGLSWCCRELWQAPGEIDISLHSAFALLFVVAEALYLLKGFQFLSQP